MGDRTLVFSKVPNLHFFFASGMSKAALIFVALAAVGVWSQGETVSSHALLSMASSV